MQSQLHDQQLMTQRHANATALQNSSQQHASQLAETNREHQAAEAERDRNFRSTEAELARLNNPGKKTTLMLNAEAAGYEPGTPRYTDYIRQMMDTDNSAEVKAAQIEAENLAKFGHELQKKLGSAMSENITGLAASAATSHRQLVEWETARGAVEGLNTGALSPTQMTLGRFASSLGVDTSGDFYKNLGISEDQVAQHGDDRTDRQQPRSSVRSVRLAMKVVSLPTTSRTPTFSSS